MPKIEGAEFWQTSRHVLECRWTLKKKNFQFWCERVSVMTALSAAVRLPRNTTAHKVTLM